MRYGTPRVSVIIPHFGECAVLHQCLRALERTTYPHFEVVVVDNGSPCSGESLKHYNLDLVYHRNPTNLGFAGGCNVGVRLARGQYVVLLNNDTVVDPGWLAPLVSTMEEHPDLAACQPRLLSLVHPDCLDYAGGMGGLMDIFGYPFAIGRIFGTVQPEKGRYSGTFRIFWASGTASIWRRDLYLDAGGLDEDFFAHMEEIDLNWRLQLLGYRICAVSASRVYHYSGYTLGHHRWRKMYLNHRNNLVMLLKNYSGCALLWLFPLRLMLEAVTALQAAVSLNGKRLLAVALAQLYLWTHWAAIWRKRKQVQSRRKVGDREIFRLLYRGSVVWQYYIRRRRDVQAFLRLRPCNE